MSHNGNIARWWTAAAVLVALLATLLVTVSAGAADSGAPGLTRFAQLPAGQLDPNSGWRHQTVGNVAPNTAQIQRSADGRSYLLIRSNESASAWAHAVPENLRTASRLKWQWTVSGAPGRSRLEDKSSDDFAARLYVVFDYPLEKVPFGQRLGIRLARAIYGDVPAAALCYVWLPGGNSDQMTDSPYSGRVKMIVATSDDEQAGWQSVQRTLATDFQRAFGAEYGPGMPPIQAIIVSADTDQTGGMVRAGFADVTLERH